MDSQASELKQITTQLLTGMLANPHIYAKVSDEGGKGQQKQQLIIAVIEMAESLIASIESRSD